MARLSTLLALGGTTVLTLAAPPDPMTLWQVEPAIDYTDRYQAGWDLIPALSEIEVYNGVYHNRTYAHHPELFAIGETVYVIYSSAAIDEDSMGQDVWISTSEDGGFTWSEGFSLMPPAILPNQTGHPLDYAYWCEKEVAQRAWQALAFVHLPGKKKCDMGELYAIGQSGTRWCPGQFRTAGRIARKITFDGQIDGDPCWIWKNELTDSQLFNETVYGTEFGMKRCEREEEINARLVDPDEAPAWSPWLYNNGLFAADDLHRMEENTYSVWHEDDDSPTGGYWQRFWRDITSGDDNTQSVWVEYNEDPEGEDWYPKVLEQYGNQVFQTNIPDAMTKQYLGSLKGSGDRYFISNPKFNSTQRERQPLVMAMSRGDEQIYRRAGVVRTRASEDFVPDTRDGLKGRAHGFSYPSAIQVGDNLLVAYSENKENIWVSVISVDDLPK